MEGKLGYPSTSEEMMKVRKHCICSASLQGITLANFKNSWDFSYKCKNSARDLCQSLVSAYSLWRYTNEIPWFPSRLPETNFYSAHLFVQGRQRVRFSKPHSFQNRFLEPAKCIHYQVKRCRHQQLCTDDSVIQPRLRGHHFPLRINFQSQDNSVRLFYFVFPSANEVSYWTILIRESRKWSKDRHIDTKKAFCCHNRN